VQVDISKSLMSLGKLIRNEFGLFLGTPLYFYDDNGARIPDDIARAPIENIINRAPFRIISADGAHFRLRSWWRFGLF
jgi:hypothetical protein